MITVPRLEEAQLRTRRQGGAIGRGIELGVVMALMRDQDYDPFSHELSLVMGPYRSGLFARGPALERFVFRVEGAHPLIEFEIELAVGLIDEDEWRAAIAPCWIPAAPRYW